MYIYDWKTDTSRLITDEEKDRMSANKKSENERYKNWQKCQDKITKPKRELYSISKEELISKRKNTRIARKLAVLYERIIGVEFPGGQYNAYIHRTYAGHWQRSEGAMSWFLDCINTQSDDGTSLMPISFGSPYPAINCLKDFSLIDYDW